MRGYFHHEKYGSCYLEQSLFFGKLSIIQYWDFENIPRRTIVFSNNLLKYQEVK